MTVLAAIGGEHEQDRIVSVADDIALAYGEDLVVLHVMEQAQFEEIRDSTHVSGPVMVPGAEDAGLAYRVSSQSVPEYNIEDGAADAKRVARECVQRTLAERRHAAVETLGRVGDPAKHVLDEAERRDVRFVVVGGRRRSPVGKALFGSVSQDVILHSDRPVVSIRRPPESAE